MSLIDALLSRNRNTLLTDSDDGLARRGVKMALPQLGTQMLGGFGGGQSMLGGLGGLLGGAGGGVLGGGAGLGNIMQSPLFPLLISILGKKKKSED